MTTLIVLASIFAYIAGWFGFTVPVARALGAAGWCHREGRHGSHKWSEQDACHRYCEPGCWRSGGVLMGQVLQAGAVGLVWPAAVLPAGAYLFANRSPSKESAQSTIDRLERECKIGELR